MTQTPAPIGDDLEVSIVIPIYNEARFLKDAVEAILAEMKMKRDRTFEVILVENGSRDDTAAVAQSLAGEGKEVFRVLSLPRPDYGGALRAGFQAARGRFIVNFDLDYWNVEFACQALKVMKDQDLIIAAKNLPQSEDRRNVYRRFITWGFQNVLHLLFDYPYHDTHGIKVWRTSAVREILPSVHFDRDLFDTEMILRGVKAGWRVQEVPIVVEEKRRPRMSIVPRIARTLLDLVALRRLVK
ncbi:MAG: glycosyltransferase [Nitrospinota bacterium]